MMGGEPGCNEMRRSGCGGVAQGASLLRQGDSLLCALDSSATLTDSARIETGPKMAYGMIQYKNFTRRSLLSKHQTSYGRRLDVRLFAVIIKARPARENFCETRKYSRA
jgi:hypothetical protein